MSRKVRKLKPTRLNVRAKTKIVPRSGRVWPRTYSTRVGWVVVPTEE